MLYKALKTMRAVPKGVENIDDLRTVNMMGGVSEEMSLSRDIRFGVYIICNRC